MFAIPYLIFSLMAMKENDAVWLECGGFGRTACGV
jgi:hypothetical protein